MNIGIELLCSRHGIVMSFIYVWICICMRVCEATCPWREAGWGGLRLFRWLVLSRCQRYASSAPVHATFLLLFLLPFSLFFLDIWLHVCVNVHTNLPTDINRQAVLQPYNEIGTYSPPSSTEMSMGFSRRV